MVSCAGCRYFWYEPPYHDQPYPEFACTRGHWDGLGPGGTDVLSDPIDCDDFVATNKLE